MYYVRLDKGIVEGFFGMSLFKFQKKKKNDSFLADPFDANMTICGISLVPGQSITYLTHRTSLSARFTYETTDPSVAAVDDSGKITAVGVGICSLVVKYYHKVVQRVVIKVIAEGFSRESVALPVGEKLRLNDYVRGGRVNGFSCSDESVACFTPQHTEELYGRQVGSCIVTFTSSDGEINELVVNVEPVNPGDEDLRSLLGEYRVLDEIWDIPYVDLYITTDPQKMSTCVAGEGNRTESGTRLIINATHPMKLELEKDLDRADDEHYTILPMNDQTKRLTVRPGNGSGSEEIVFEEADGTEAQSFTLEQADRGFYILTCSGAYLTGEDQGLRATGDKTKAKQFFFIERK